MTPDEYQQKQYTLAHDLLGVEPVLLGGPTDRNRFIIRCEMLIPLDETRARKSGEYINLGISAADAMRLLAMLSSTQKKLGIPIPEGEATFDFVPPDEKKH